jgi:DnaJ-class molecular chaperone
MRKIKSDIGFWRQELKGLPKGICKTCGGKGKYKETFKHKNPIIHHCSSCSGTGNIKIRVKYIAETDYNRGLWNGNMYELISENESTYVILSQKNEMLQMEKKLFKSID